MGGNDVEADACAWWQLPATSNDSGSSTAITGYPPVTGWSRRKMTGCPLVGTSIAPDGVASLASSRVSVRSTGAAPESRRPTRFDCAVTVHVCVRNADRPAAVNQSSRGPNRTYKSVGSAGFRQVGRPWLRQADAGIARRGRGTYGEPLFGCDRARADAAHRVRCSRTEGCRDAETAAYGHIIAQAAGRRGD